MNYHLISFIERPGFRRFCNVAVPKFVIPSRKVIVKTFLRMYESKKEEHRKELSSHCVFDNQNIDIASKHKLYGTAHFIDNGWKMHKRVLNFYVISNNQGITIGKILEGFNYISS
jgi:hypothetical protein